MRIDMHIHSTYSDGEHTPMQLLDTCNQQNISIMSITDHDNILGAKEAIRCNPYSHINIIPGIELNAKYKNGQLHILGYNISLENDSLNEICRLIMEDNVRRLKSLIDNIKKVYNISFSDEDLFDVFKSVGNIGRPEIAKLCVKYGYTSTVEEAFSKLFEPIKNMTVKKEVELTAYDCIKYINEAGGIACLAHPITLKKDIDDLKAYITLLKSYGLEAVEVYHSKHSEKYSNQIFQITQELNLLCSAGSDYHGEIVKPNVFIGKYNKDNLDIKDITILSKIL